MTTMSTRSFLFVIALAFLLFEGDDDNGGKSCRRIGRAPERFAQSFLKRVNKAPLTSIQSPDGDIIDCVPISKQPAFDNPLLKHHTIQMRPSYIPGSLYDDSNNVPHSITQTYQNGKCPENSIPIRRTEEEDVLRTSSVKWYGKKRPVSILKQYPVSSDVTTTDLHQVYPAIYGDDNPRLFIYWTSDGYQNTGCYNLLCSGFVQTNQQIAIGGSLSPQSVYDGAQLEFDILVWKDSTGGNWWLQVGSSIVGYWPSSIFTNLNDSASMIDWGGDVYLTLQMA